MAQYEGTDFGTSVIGGYTYYLTDSSNLPLLFSGSVVPVTGNYSKGSIFILTSAAGGVDGVYLNSGTTSAPSFNIVGTAAGSISNAQLDPMMQQYKTVSLTAANLIAMFTTPVSVIAAPGTGKAIIVDTILFEMTTTATQFTGGGAVDFVFHGTSTATHTGTIPASIVTTTAGTSNTQLGSPTAANGTTVMANTGVDITNATAAFAAGTGTAKVQIWYSVVTL